LIKFLFLPSLYTIDKRFAVFFVHKNGKHVKQKLSSLSLTKRQLVENHSCARLHIKTFIWNNIKKVYTATDKAHAGVGCTHHRCIKQTGHLSENCTACLQTHITPAAHPRAQPFSANIMEISRACGSSKKDGASRWARFFKAAK